MTTPTDNGRRAPDNTIFYKEVPALSAKGNANLIRVSIYNDGTIGFGIGEEWRRFSRVAIQITKEDLRACLAAIETEEEWEVVRLSTSLKQPKERKLRYTARRTKQRPHPRIYMYRQPTDRFIETSAMLDGPTGAALTRVLRQALGAAT